MRVLLPLDQVVPRGGPDNTRPSKRRTAKGRVRVGRLTHITFDDAVLCCTGLPTGALTLHLSPTRKRKPKQP